MRTVNMVLTFSVDVVDDSPKGLDEEQHEDYLVDKAAGLIGQGRGDLFECDITPLPENEGEEPT